jgi:predicted ATPase/transcriptional regulator with XRE-family HTH domain
MRRGLSLFNAWTVMRDHESIASVGELLRDHRRTAGLTQEELAERAGVSPRSISEWERGGAHVPRRDTVALLVRALSLEGADRQAFEAVVDRDRRPRLKPTLASPPNEQLPALAGRAIERPKHNMPRSLTSFVGREREVIELAQVLPTAALLTLVGAGGVGKTRLAQELVRNNTASYADGSWLVELAGLADPSLVPGEVARAVGLRDFQARHVTNMLTEYLRPKHLLLVLDNCEHLVAACAALVAHLLRTCPYLHVLATSREPLAIAGEITWRVPPLELPDLQRTQSPEQIMRTAAVRLFIERARAVNNTLVLTDDNAPALARICMGVDGIPLALELAAARARVLTVEQLADRLDYDSGVLGGATRAGLPQHRTIRATIDWSHDLLGQQEQVLLRRLSVFAAGWTLHLAEVVCSDGGIERSDVLDLLTQLVDKSMAVVDSRDAVVRYRMLQPIRQYAVELLEASGEARTYRARHADTFLESARMSDAGLAGPNEISSLDRFEVEHDNIRVALRWALDHQDSEAALRSSAALFRFWERRGHFQEGCAWLEQALASGGDAPARYRGLALNALAFLCWRGGDPERALPIADEALAVNREVGKARDVAQSLLNLGMIAYHRNELGLASARLEESVLFARQAGYVPQLSLALAFLGRTLLRPKGPQNPRAAAAIEESLALAGAVQGRYATGHALMTLGDLVWRQGDVERAIPLWQRALEVRTQLADRRGIAGSLERLAWGLATGDHFAPAAWLFGAVEAQHAVLGITLRHDEQADHTHFVAVTRRRLGDTFARAWSDGQASSVDEAIVRALESTRLLPTAIPVR